LLSGRPGEIGFRSSWMGWGRNRVFTHTRARYHRGMAGGTSFGCVGGKGTGDVRTYRTNLLPRRAAGASGDRVRVRVRSEVNVRVCVCVCVYGPTNRVGLVLGCVCVCVCGDPYSVQQSPPYLSGVTVVRRVEEPAVRYICNTAQKLAEVPVIHLTCLVRVQNHAHHSPEPFLFRVGTFARSFVPSFQHTRARALYLARFFFSSLFPVRPTSVCSLVPASIALFPKSRSFCFPIGQVFRCKTN